MKPMYCTVHTKLWIFWWCVLVGFASGLTPTVKEEDARPICKCGSSLKPLQTRVVGGRNAIHGDFPYATGLVPSYGKDFARRILGHPDFTPYCGGTLITDRHVLTAAHCVRDRKASEINLDVGEYNIEDQTERRILRDASNLLKHPGYVSEVFRNDIAIIEMDKPVNLNSKLKAAWLPPQDIHIAPGTPVTVYGWGRLDYEGGRPEVLQVLQIPVVSRSECQKHILTPITSTMMCAGGEKGRDACIGDSGSGLTVKQKDEYVLTGVVSFGRRCALPGVPGVYTKVSSFVEWIYENTRSAECQPCIASVEDFAEHAQLNLL